MSLGVTTSPTYTQLRYPTGRLSFPSGVNSTAAVVPPGGAAGAASTQESPAIPTRTAILTATFDLNDPSMVLPRRFRGKTCCAFALCHVTGRGKATPGPRRVT